MDRILSQSRLRFDDENERYVSLEELSIADSLLGRKDGTEAARRMTPAQKRARAVKATTTRWAKVREQEKENHESSR